MIARDRLVVVGLVVVAAWARPAEAQTTRHVIVVQIAGANLYFNAGTDSGITTGDTLQVRRIQSDNPIGGVVVLSATPTRSVVGFAGQPFSVTRGDSLVVITRAGTAAVALGPAPPPASQGAAPAPARLTRRSSGAIGFEIAGAHTITYGLGSDPTQNTEDFATPDMRFRWSFDNPASGTGLRLNLMATDRAGPSTLFDQQNVLQIYEARFDQTIGRNAARISVGRFLSNFDYSSGYWDGAMVRIGTERGLSAGLAGGFEPERTNESFDINAPKVAAFVNLRVGRSIVRYRNDVAVHQMLPTGASPRQSIIDWSERLDAGGFHLGHDIEAGPDIISGQWNVSRFQARMSLPLPASSEFYSAVVSDQPNPVLVDTSLTQVFERRERATVGFSHRSGSFYADLDFTVNSPFTPDSRGEAAGFSFGVSGRKLSVVGAANYFTFPQSQGLFASPGLEYRFGGVRAHIGYQFLLSEATLYSVQTHGVDVMIARTLSTRVDWMTRLNARYGDNLRSLGIYSSLDVRF